MRENQSYLFRSCFAFLFLCATPGCFEPTHAELSTIDSPLAAEGTEVAEPPKEENKDAKTSNPKDKARAKPNGLKWARKGKPTVDSGEAKASTIEDSVKPSPKLAEAAYKKALAFDKGDGVDRDVRKAAQFFERAAKLGHTESMFQIGCMYATGDGVERNSQQAVRWYKKGVDAGDVRAMRNYADHLDRGDGVKEDWPQAVALLRRAASLGYEPAISLVERIDRAERNDAHYNRAAEAAQERQRASDETDRWRRKNFDNDGSPRKN